MKRTWVIRSQRRIVCISAATLLAAVLVVVQVGFQKSEQMLMEKTSGLIAGNLEKNEASLWGMLDTVRKLSAASSTNKAIAELLLQAANEAEELGVRKSVSNYSSEDLLRIRQVESLLTNYRNTFFDYQVHSVILGSDGSIYSVLDGVDNSSLFGANFMDSIAEQDWYQRFLESGEVSTWSAPCYYSKNGTFQIPDQADSGAGADSYLLFVRKIRDYTTQKELGVSVVSVPAHNLERLLSLEFMGGLGLVNSSGQVIYASQERWEACLEEFFTHWQAGEGEPRGHTRDRLMDGEYLVNYSTLPITGWQLINLTPYEAVVAEIMDLRRYIYLFGLAIAAGAIALCTAVLLHTTMPLGRLFERIGEMHIGHRQVGGSGEPVGGRGVRITNVPQAEAQINRMLDRIEALSREALQLQELEQNLQYETLRAQLNPHFLFNTLNTIKWSAMVSGAGNIADMISSLGCLLENSMRRGEETVSLGGELEMVRAYMQIKNWALKYRYALHIQVPGELLEYRVLKFCLQPLVENAMIHGIEGMEDGQVTVTGCRRGDDILLEVADNGRGMTAQRAAQVLEEGRPETGRGIHQISGVGLSSVNGMIKLRYGEQYGLSIRSAPGEGTTVRLSLPWREEKEEAIAQGGVEDYAARVDC